MTNTLQEERAHWTDEAKALLQLERGEKPPTEGKFSVIGPRLKTHLNAVSDYSQLTPIAELRAGMDLMTPPAQAIAQRMINFYGNGTEPPTLDPVSDAATFGVVSVEAIAPYLLARGGAKFMAEAMVASHRVSSTTFGRPGSASGYGRCIELDVAKGGTVLVVARWIRAVFDNEQKKEARAIFDAARTDPNATFSLRLATSIAAGDRAWAVEDANEYLSAKKTNATTTPLPYDTARNLLLVLRDVPLLNKIAKKDGHQFPLYTMIDDLGLDVAPTIAEIIEAAPDFEGACAAAAVLECLATAKALAHSLATKNGGAAARAFYRRRPDLAFVALAPIVAAETKLAAFVKPTFEETLKAHPDFLKTLAEHLDSKTRAVFAKLAAEREKAKSRKPASMGDVPRAIQAWPEPRKGKKIKELPDFADASKFPSIVLANGESTLPESAADNLLATLMQSTLDDPDPNIPVLKKAFEPSSANAFVWALFEAWLAAGADSKQGWAFTALGHLGNDDTARKLTPLIRAWPGESQHARAVNGCGILAAIGTDIALMHLHGIAQKVKFKGLQQRAQMKIQEIANARKLTAEQLGDRLVPDLGLDESGSMELDLGSRKFTVGFDHTLKPFVHDGTGKRVGKADLPKANKSDDAELAAAAHEKWKLLKKDAKAIAATQIARFEMAMCSQRRWSPDDFKTFIVDHPLVVHIARRLVFGVFDAAGKKLAATFRVSEDRTYANDRDETLAVKSGDDQTIGVAHRLELEDAALARWGEILGEYEIIQPFDQLGRAIFRASDAERGSNALDRMKGVTVKTGKILGLEHRGWRKGPPQDAGWVWNMVKPLAGGLEADLNLKGGICMGYMEGTPSEQELGSLTLNPTRGTLGDLSATAFSELVRDLEMLRDA